MASFQKTIVSTGKVGDTFNLVYAFCICQHNLSIQVLGMAFLTT